MIVLLRIAQDPEHAGRSLERPAVLPSCPAAPYPRGMPSSLAVTRRAVTRRQSAVLPAHIDVTGWLSNSILSTVKTMLISIVLREKKQRLEAVRGVHCIDQ